MRLPVTHTHGAALRTAQGSCGLVRKRKTGRLLRNGDFHSWAFVINFLPRPAAPPRAPSTLSQGWGSCHWEPRGRCGNGTETEPGTFFSCTVEPLAFLTTATWSKSTSRSKPLPHLCPSAPMGRVQGCAPPLSRNAGAELVGTCCLPFNGPWLTQSRKPAPGQVPV